MKWDKNPINVGNPKSKKMKQKETIQSYLGWPYQMHTRESQWLTSLPSFCCWITNNQGLRAKIKRLRIVGIKWDKCDEHMRHGNGLLSCTDQSGPSRHTGPLTIQLETSLSVLPLTSTNTCFSLSPLFLVGIQIYASFSTHQSQENAWKYSKCNDSRKAFFLFLFLYWATDRKPALNTTRL